MNLRQAAALSSNTPAFQPSFSEKSFYLEEFRGKSLLFALIPPAGRQLSELKALLKTLRELKRNQTRCLVVAEPLASAALLRRAGRLRPRALARPFEPRRSVLRGLFPPDSVLGELWLELSASALVVATVNSDEPAIFLRFVSALASRLRVFKAVLIDPDGGLREAHGTRVSFLETKRIRRLVRARLSDAQRRLVGEVRRMLDQEVGSVNLTTPAGVYDELFSYLGTGTLFTKAPYGTARPISIDEFDQAQAMIERGQAEGALLRRTREEVAGLLPSCVGYRLGERQLAGVCSLLTEPYLRDRAGEITALYTLTRFQGEGVASQLIREVLREARARRLKYVFACTSEPHAARLFERLNFKRAAPHEVAAAKWQGYDQTRRSKLMVFRYDL